MIRIEIPIEADLADDLEAHFCEDYQQAWMIDVAPGTGDQRLCGFFTSHEDALAAHGQLRGEFAGLPDIAVIGELADQDWKEAYKLHFKPWSERGLHWVPVWERAQYQLPAGEQIVYLDPGMAFGTGNHETTRLCVRRLLDARDRWGAAVAEKSVIDAGCGSGILAISAAKIGFAPVYGFDNDPDAVRISIENAALCELDDRIEWLWNDLEDGLDGRSCDCLMANILAPILVRYRGRLCAAVRKGGELILSGILAAEVAEVHAAFAPEVAAITGSEPPFDSRTDGDWADLRYRF
jgi:ribosomal protein L11 methyltransferase